MLKALGVVLVIFVCVYSIYTQIGEKKKKIQNLRQMKKALTYLKHELAFNVPEIAGLCEQAAKKTCGEISAMFAGVRKNLQKDSSIDFFAAWKMEQGEKTLFSENVQDVVFELFSDFGKKSLDIELNNIERTQLFLEEAEKEEEKKYQSDRKLICTLGAAFCAAIVIIVI